MKITPIVCTIESDPDLPTFAIVMRCGVCREQLSRRVFDCRHHSQQQVEVASVEDAWEAQAHECKIID